jgi:hypothetical protein
MCIRWLFSCRKANDYDMVMLSILEKAHNTVPKINQLITPPVQIHLKGVEEQRYYHLAISRKYISGSDGKIACFYNDGLDELNKLIEVRRKRMHENLKIYLQIAALVIPIICVFLSFIFSMWTVWVTTRNVREQPVRVIGVVEVLLKKDVSAQNGNQEPESCKSDTDACESCTNVHEN